MILSEDDDGLKVTVTLTEYANAVQISHELAQGFVKGLSLGFRDAAKPLTRRQRLRAWLRRTTWDARVRLASWIVGFGVTDRDEDY